MQSSDLETSDPLVAINAGNHAQAVALLHARRADGTASQTDIELLALAQFETGNPKEASILFRELGLASPRVV